MKTKLTITALVFAILLGGVYLYFVGKRYEIVITQEQIDSALTEAFPVTKRHLLIFSITYSNPQATLLEGSDRVRVGMDATLNIRIDDEPKELGGGVTITSGFRFEPTTHEFFLDDAQFERFEIQGIPERWLEQVKSFASKAAGEFVETKPVYRLEAKDAKTTAAKMLLKGVEVREQTVHITLGI